MDEGALAVARHAPPLPVCGLAAPGRGLLASTVNGECAHALGATVCGRDDCAHDRLAGARAGMTARGHTGPTTGHVTAVLFPLMLLVWEEELAAWTGSPGSQGGC